MGSEGDDCARKRLKLESDNPLQINELYRRSTGKLSTAFTKGQPLTFDNSAEVIASPFTCCILPDFLTLQDFVTDLKCDISQLELKKKVNDLYQFEQSEDLKDCSLIHIKKFRQFLQVEILPWMKEVSKIDLNNEIALFASSYSMTDHLLCHDDELENRRIAFIFYLVPEWTEEDGGNLQLFNTVNGFPEKVCRTIVPRSNSFVFFEVSPVSFHQVSEVLSSKQRVALSGWFHGPSIDRPTLRQDTVLFKEPCSQEIDVTDWINPMYLDLSMQVDIGSSFEENSEILLADFLQKDKFDEVCQALLSSEISWLHKGPANCRSVFEADETSIPDILKECCAFLTSEAFFLILSNLTSLSFHPMSDDGAKMGKVYAAIRKWPPGSYTLLRDQSFAQESCLSAFLYFNCDDWSPFYNGFCSFVAKGEDEELLRIEPTPNSLALVYTSEETSHFVKYINNKSKECSFPYFHDIFCIYLEDNDENKE